MPNIVIKPLDVVTKKWAARAGAAGADYAYGVQNNRRPQAQAAAAAAPAWAAGVQQAVADGRYAKNVLAASDKYQRNAAGKGAQRYPSGVQAAQGDFSTGIGPYLTALSNLQLQPRLPKGDPGNLARVQQVTQALRQLKLSR